MKIKKNKIRILIVDDEDDITFSFKRILEIHGFEVDAFNDSSLALSKFKTNYYDIALLDIKMPNLDGFDLYKKIKEMDNNIRLCFLTASEAYYQQFREKDFYELSRDLFIQKPIELEELLKRIDDLMK
ncbi:MAG TPA: response regulator [Candidatus Nitrosocosmicus sp.]|jgi:two-component system catabolic regulation response regulator CreB|nr:response regulator [Candidatus Nitrosocosmicus sp.]